jgi:16S rRNA (cytosine1402-N4)-methyltransferase
MSGTHGEAGRTHVSVLVPQVCDALSPALNRGAGGRGIYVDATAGLGGHAQAIVAATRPEACVLIDRDPMALQHAAARLADAPCPIHYVHAEFASIAEVLADLRITRVDAILADLGVSSMQLDDGTRGFSFRTDAPLDMRMDPSRGPTAAEAIERLDAAELARILREYGEEPDARRIATAIVTARPRTTGQLADVVTEAMSARQRRQLGRRIHPATRTFMALRIHVNGELEQIDRFLQDAPSRLVVGGRLGVISFHSLEDRRVKQAIRRLSSRPPVPAGLPVREADLPAADFTVPSGWARGATPTEAEISANPRARSARLRVVERCQP